MQYQLSSAARLHLAIQEFKQTHNLDKLTPEQDKKYWELLVAYERANNSRFLG